VPSNRSIVGDQLFQVESGIIANWFKNCGLEHQTELFPFKPEFVGQPAADVVIGKGSGMDTINIWLERLQIQASEEQAMVILAAVKASGLKKKDLLTVDEFKAIANDTIAEVA